MSSWYALVRFIQTQWLDILVLVWMHNKILRSKTWANRGTVLRTSRLSSVVVGCARLKTLFISDYAVCDLCLGINFCFFRLSNHLLCKSRSASWCFSWRIRAIILVSCQLTEVTDLTNTSLQATSCIFFLPCKQIVYFGSDAEFELSEFLLFDELGEWL